MSEIFRDIEPKIQASLGRGKSILLLGARQTGKTTLIKHINHDLGLNLMLPETRLRYETTPQSLYQEVMALKPSNPNKPPLVIIDEVQKVPDLMDVTQVLIDENRAQFILTGSSARKLRRSKKINLLPGRIIKYQLDPITLPELQHSNFDVSLNNLLNYGSLPEVIRNQNDDEANNELLSSYVVTYLEEEVRAEALVRDVGKFNQFLQLAAAESGNMIHISAISQQLGISQHTVSAHYEILVDCLLAEQITPLIKSSVRKRLAKAPKYLFFDLGVRRFCAKEGNQPSQQTLGYWFEQWVGLELCRQCRLKNPLGSVHFWHDNDSGVEVDWVVCTENTYIPIEVKLTTSPTLKDARHLQKFLSEYKEANKGYIVCQTPRAMKLTDNITAIPWSQLSDCLED